MSFDLYVFEPVSPLDTAQLQRATCEEHAPERLFCVSDASEAFAGALVCAFPNLGLEEDGSPFAATVSLGPEPIKTINLLWSRVEDVAGRILELAYAHGLGVFDPQAGLTYNPPRLYDRTSVFMESPWLLSRVFAHQPLLGDLVASLATRGEDPYCVLERDDGAYMQTLARSDGLFELEHRVAGPETHRHLAEGAALNTVVTALSWFAEGDRRWTNLSWVPLVLG